MHTVTFIIITYLPKIVYKFIRNAAGNRQKRGYLAAVLKNEINWTLIKDIQWIRSFRSGSHGNRIYR